MITASKRQFCDKLNAEILNKLKRLGSSYCGFWHVDLEAAALFTMKKI